jgi:hypothetical protein
MPHRWGIPLVCAESQNDLGLCAPLMGATHIQDFILFVNICQ